jgi:hypothetical protein
MFMRRPDPTLVDLELAFRAWVEGPTRPDIVTLGDGDGDGVAIALEQVLEALLESKAPLAPARGRTLGLDHGACIALAARRLLDARLDPGGPRCRSFRAATYYLSGLSRIEAGDDADPADERIAPFSPVAVRA